MIKQQRKQRYSLLITQSQYLEGRVEETFCQEHFSSLEKCLDTASVFKEFQPSIVDRVKLTSVKFTKSKADTKRQLKNAN